MTAPDPRRLSRRVVAEAVGTRCCSRPWWAPASWASGWPAATSRGPARQHGRHRCRPRRADPHVRADLGRALQSGGHHRRGVAGGPRVEGRPAVRRGAGHRGLRRGRGRTPDVRRAGVLRLPPCPSRVGAGLQRVRGDVRPGRGDLGPRANAERDRAICRRGVFTAAYWFTASTSFANPAVTLARAATDTFAGIRPVDVPVFVAAQLVGAAAAAALFRWLVPALPATAPAVVPAPMPAGAASADPTPVTTAPTR
jgi:hypothetical protein